MTTITFRLNCGQYVIHRDGLPVSAPQDEIAIALDKDDGTRFKVGVPAQVKAWYDATVKQYRDNGFADIADSIVLIQGRFTIEDLDAVMSTTSYAEKLYRQLNEGTLSFLDIHGNVVAPALPA